MRKIVFLIVALCLLSSCSFLSKQEPETCDLTEHQYVMDEMAFIVGKLREQIHKLGTEANPDYLAINSETSDLLETTKKMKVPPCLEESKYLLIATIESTLFGIELFQTSEPLEAINHININTQETLNQFIQELITVINNQPDK